MELQDVQFEFHPNREQPHRKVFPERYFPSKVFLQRMTLGTSSVVVMPPLQMSSGGMLRYGGG